MKRLIVVALLFVAACSRLRKPAPKAEDAGPSMSAPASPVAEREPEPEPAPTATMLEAKDLPLGHWETSGGAESEKLALTLLPDGLVRIATAVPRYRNPARVFGQVTHVEGDDADTFRIWVDVTKILAKEIGSHHRWWEDFDLFEAEILGTRVTSPNQNGHHVPDLGGQGPAPPPSYKLGFDKSRGTVDLCTLAPTPRCKKLTKKKSPSDFSRVRTKAECKTDDDCTVVTDGEQCDPCLCPSKASVRSWPHKVDPDKEDSTWESQPEHLCGKDISRKDTCPPCPTLRAVCKHKACGLRP